MLIVGSSGIAVGATGTSQPAGTLHAIGAGHAAVCGASRVAYIWPAVRWTATGDGDRCASCVAQTPVVPTQPSAADRADERLEEAVD